MVTINSTLNNFSEIPIFHNVFSGFGNEYEYTENEIFRTKKPPQCPKCDNNMVHNGFNSYTKKSVTITWCIMVLTAIPKKVWAP
jgi:hypothetical protein